MLRHHHPPPPPEPRRFVSVGDGLRFSPHQMIHAEFDVLRWLAVTTDSLAERVIDGDAFGFCDPLFMIAEPDVSENDFAFGDGGKRAAEQGFDLIK